MLLTHPAANMILPELEREQSLSVAGSELVFVTFKSHCENWARISVQTEPSVPLARVYFSETANGGNNTLLNIQVFE